MDKKKQFQIDTLKGKIETYKVALNKLLDQRVSLESQLSISNPDRSKVDNLIKEKQLLETQLQSLKKQITTITNNITFTNTELKQLPGIRDSKLANESTILDNEIERIELKGLELDDIYNTKLEQSRNDRESIKLDIEDVKVGIEQQNAIIKELQFDAHVSRKSILDQLHQRKEEKKEINRHKSDLQQFIDDSQKQIDDLKTAIVKLEGFKISIVNAVYNLSTTPEQIEYLDSLYLEFNIEKKIPINEKIKIIDRKIADADRRIQVITKKTEKNKIGFEQRLKTIIENYNRVNRVSRTSYKDQFKMEKEKRSEYLDILSSLESKYNNWIKEVEDKILEEYHSNYGELNYDIERAHKRLDIMTQRIQTEFEDKTVCLTKRNEELVEEMKATRTEFDNINSKIKEIQQMIEQEDSVGNAVSNLDIEISKYQSMINQTQTNITTLSC